MDYIKSIIVPVNLFAVLCFKACVTYELKAF
jgi:hypothetical protein